MDKPNLPNFREEQSAKIPALTLLTSLGYKFIPPSHNADEILKTGFVKDIGSVLAI